MKQIYILLIALLMGLSANAKSSGTCGPNLKWHITDDGVLTISGKGEMDDYNYHDGSPWENSGVKRIIIGDSVTTIGEYAFSYCRSLTSVNIPNSVTTIGRAAFNGCSSLTSVTIPNSVTAIGDNAFYNTNMTKIIWLTNTPPDGYSNVQGRIHYVANDMYTGLSNKKVYPYLSSIFEVDGIKYVPVSPSEHICDAIDCTYTGDELKINKKVNYKGVDMTVREINPYIACCAKIKKVYIENGFTTIGDYAFSYCRALTSVTIPNSVTTIGDGAFSYCNNLTSVTIPNSVTTIGNSAFKNCSSLTSVTIPNSVTTIDRWVFSSCSSLTSVTIGNSVTTIVDNAFDNTYNKTKIIWLTNTPPDGYRNVGGDIHYVANDLYTGLSNKKVYPYLSSIFEVDGIKYVPVSPSERTCDAIDCAYTGEPYEVKINKKVNYKGVDMTVREFNPYTAYECAKIKKAYIDIGGSIGNDAFSGCTNLTSVDIKKANDIGNNAFSKCTNLVSVDIKAGNNIGESAFSNCSSLETLSLDNKIKSLGRSAFENCRNLKQFVIPDSVTILNYLLLYDCSSLKSIRIHKSIKEIDKAFNGCTNLSTLIIEDRNTPLKIVSNNNPLFKDCKLDSVYIGGKIVYETSSDYRYSPFYRNASLRTVRVSDAETTIYDNEFYGCTNLQNVSIGDNVESIGEKAFSGCSALTSVTIPNSVTRIGSYAFDGCSALTSVTIPNSVTIIGWSTFKDCSALTSITIPNSVTIIGWNTFSNCSRLTSVTIPNSITTIGDYAFDGCSALTSVTIPNSVTTIRSYAFRGCSALTSVTIPNSVTTIGEYDFAACSALTSVTIPNSVTEIGDYAFTDCRSLTSVTIPNSVTTIGGHAFADCTNLQKVNIGNSVKEIWRSAFENCTSITQISCEAVVPPFCDLYAFNHINKSECKLIVPKNSLDAYKQAPQWKDFLLIEGSTTGITNTVYNNSGLADVYTIDGTKRLSKASTDEINALPKGVYIVNGKKIIIK